MEQAKRITEVRAGVRAARLAGRTVGVVPTMGALHEGHFSLMRRCREECGYAAVSIFVNPTQFGAGEDLGAYPRTLEADLAGCAELGVDLVFVPEAGEMYPREQLAWVEVEGISGVLCGASRPGHFRGVCTVVAKLFGIFGPDRAYFGEKDAQQLAVIRRMVADLNMPVEVVGCPIVREAEGLAMSSRNRYLSEEQRRQALSLHRSLGRAAELVAGGERQVGVIVEAMLEVFAGEPEVRVDYVSVVDRETLREVERIEGEVLVAVAAWVGPARLIDNISLDRRGLIS